MSQGTELSRYQQKHTEDYLHLASQLLYALAALVFIGGLYYDMVHTGQKVIPIFAIADEPQANSGLFILAMLIGLIGFLCSRASAMLDEWRVEEVEDSQEWEVDV